MGGQLGGVLACWQVGGGAWGSGLRMGVLAPGLGGAGRDGHRTCGADGIELYMYGEWEGGVGWAHRDDVFVYRLASVPAGLGVTAVGRVARVILVADTVLVKPVVLAGAA